MLNEFREFAIKGNVVDMAVGIIIGAAFTAIVQSVVDDVLMPVMGLATGGLDFSEHYVMLRAASEGATYATVAEARAAGAVVLAWGQLVNATVRFVLIALALFFLVRGINRLRRSDTKPAPTTKSCPFCKASIDEAASRCSQCTSMLDGEVAAASDA